MSAATIAYRFGRGEPIFVQLEDVEGGDSSPLTDRKAVLKKALPGPRVPPAAAVSVAQFLITPRAATPQIASGFDLIIPASVSKTLDVGLYVVTPAFGAGGVVQQIADALFIEIKETTTDSVTP
jgi:hypothetical protein